MGAPVRKSVHGENRVGPGDAVTTVLLIDDMPSQAARIRERLAHYGFRVDWRRSCREATERLRHPAAGRLVDLVLIDQTFDSVPRADLLTPSEIGAPAEARSGERRVGKEWR